MQIINHIGCDASKTCMYGILALHAIQQEVQLALAFDSNAIPGILKIPCHLHSSFKH